MKQRTNVTFEYKVLNTKDIKVDYLYQREVDLKRVGKIVKDYDVCIANIPKVSYRDGKYWCFDGQHTISAEKMVHGKGKDIDIICKVFHGLSRLDEMELFITQNGESESVSANDRLKALYNFGDEDVNGMVQAATLAGVRVDFAKGKAVNKVTNLNTLMRIYLNHKDNVSRLTEILSIVRQAWHGDPDSFNKSILLGLDKFYERYNGQFKPCDLVSVLNKTSFDAIVANSKSLTTFKNTADRVAAVILRCYNNQKRKKLPDFI